MKRRSFLKGMSLAPFAGFFGYKAAEPIIKPDLPVIEFAKKVMFPWKAKGVTFPFPIDEFHKKIAQSYEDEIACLILKHRQGGFSTFNLIQGFYDSIHKPEFKSVYFSNNLSMSNDLAALAYDIAVNNLDLIWTHIKSISDWGIKFNNGSNLLFASRSGLPRCYVNRVYFDEAAWIANLEKYHTTVWPMLCNNPHPGMKVCFTSTPYKKQGYFYALYNHKKKCDAYGKENNLKILKFSYRDSKFWRDNPEQLANVKRNLDKKTWKQEMEAEFI